MATDVRECVGEIEKSCTGPHNDAPVISTIQCQFCILLKEEV
jgi:hypothetical protein